MGKAARLRRALTVAGIGSALIWITTFAHVWWQIGIAHGYLAGGVYPLAPSLPVTLPSLALMSLSGAIVHLVPAGVMAALPLAGGWRVAGLGLLYCGAWLFGAEAVAGEFAFDFGTTWAGGEAFRELFLHPVATPALLLGGAAAYLWRVRRA